MLSQHRHAALPPRRLSAVITVILLSLISLSFLPFSNVHVVIDRRKTPLSTLTHTLSNTSPYLHRPHAPDGTNASSASTIPPHCVHIVRSDLAHDKDDWIPFNSRTFCITSPVCIRPRTLNQSAVVFHDYAPLALASQRHQPTCQMTGPSMTTTVHNDKFNCSKLLESVFCAHGHYAASTNTPLCPMFERQMPPLGDSDYIRQYNITLLDGLAVFIPAYPFTGNIYHFAQAFVPLVHMLSRLDTFLDPVPDTVHLVFRGRRPEDLGLWQKGMFGAVMNQRVRQLKWVRERSVQFKVSSTLEDIPFVHESGLFFSYDVPVQAPNTVCASAGVLLGERYSSMMWPFANEKELGQWPFSARRHISEFRTNNVPFEAVQLRAAVYHELNVSTVLPPAAEGDAGVVKRLVLDFPPEVVTYARRITYKEVQGNSTGRRFSSADDSWLGAMLKRESRRMGFKFQLGEPHLLTPFDQQVAMFRGSGVLMGIHGANLMNALFMPAFSTIVEVSPLTYQCYVSGSNSGLLYWHYRPHTEADEAGVHRNHRRIPIGTGADRRALRKIARQAMRSVRDLRRWFGHVGGVPVVYDEVSGAYHIEWGSRAGLASYAGQVANDWVTRQVSWKRKKRTA